MGMITLLLSHQETYVALCLSVCVFFLTRSLIRWRSLRPDYPPGPWGLPILGYLPFITLPIPKGFQRLVERYGSVFSVQLGLRHVIVLNTIDDIAEACKSDQLTDRPFAYTTDVFRAGGERAIVFIDGEKWRFQRKAGLRALSTFATSRNSKLQPKTEQGVGWLLAKIDALGGEPVNTVELLFPTTAAIMSALCFGTDAYPETPYFEKLFGLVKDIVSSRKLITLDFFPILYPFYKNVVDSCIENVDKINTLILDESKRYLAAKSDFTGINEIASAVERIIQNTPDDEKVAHGSNDAEMRVILSDFFFAGIFTSSDNSAWALLLLAAHPEIQERLASEIREVVGTNAIIDIENELESLHYLRAVFFESLRIGCNTAFALPHKASGDVRVGEFTIPAGSTVIPNVYAATRDPKRFPEPDRFWPDRFLDQNGVFLPSHTADVILFGVGKRRCVGEGLAIQTIPVIIGSVIQRFWVTLDPATRGDPVSQIQTWITVAPGPHKLIFTPRADLVNGNGRFSKTL